MDLNLLQPPVKEILAKLGYRLHSMLYVNEGPDLYLRVIVDKYHHKVSLDEIVTISEQIDALLDLSEEENAFILDVTTTGAEKEIDINEIENYVEEFIEITLSDGIKGPPTLKGMLSAVSDEHLTLLINLKGRIKKQNIARNEIKRINRAIKFNKKD